MTTPPTILQLKTSCTVQQQQSKQYYETASLMIVNKVLVLCECSPTSNKIIVHMKLQDGNIFIVKRMDLFHNISSSSEEEETTNTAIIPITIVYNDMLIEIGIPKNVEEKFDALCNESAVQIVTVTPPPPSAAVENSGEAQEAMSTTSTEETKRYNSVVASSIDDAAQFVSTNMLYGAQLIGDGMDASGEFIRTNVVGDKYRTDVKLPGVVKGTVYVGERVTYFGSWASGLVIDGIVNSVSFVATNAVAPLVNAVIPGGDGESNPDSYVTTVKEVASSTVSGIGSLITAVQESKEILVTDLKSSTYQTVSHTLGNDAAAIAKDAISTVNNCVNVASNTSGVKAVATKIAAKTAVKSIKNTVQAVKEHQEMKKAVQNSMMETDEPTETSEYEKIEEEEEEVTQLIN